MKALASLFGAALGALAFCLGIFLLSLGLGHLFGMRAGGDTFDFILLLPGLFFAVFGPVWCRRSWRKWKHRPV